MTDRSVLMGLLFAAAAVLTPCCLQNVASAQVQDATSASLETPSTTGDWEDRLSRNTQAQRAWRLTLNNLAGKNITASQRQKILNSMVERFPDSQGSAQQQVLNLLQLGKAGKWEQYLAGSADWFKQFDRWSDAKHRLLYDMARKLYQKDVPDSIKYEIFEGMLPHLAHRAWIAAYLNNYIERLNLPESQKYALAQRAAQSAGRNYRLRIMLWTRINKLKQSDPQLALAAAKKLLEQYGPDSSETRQAKIFILQQTAANSDKDDKQSAKLATTLQTQTTQATAKLKTDFDTALPILLGADAQAAAHTIEQLLTATPLYLHVSLWQKIRAELGDMTSPARLAIMRQNASRLGDSSVADDFRLWALRDLITHPQEVQTLLAIQQQCNNDAGRSLNMWDYTLKQLENANYPPSVLARGYSMAAEMATALGAHDQAATWLFDAARLNWVFDLAVAKKQLAQAATTSEWSPSGVKAAWFLAYLDGRNDVIQPLAPRDYDSANQVSTDLPSCTLPTLGAPQDAVTQSVAGWTLTPNDPKNNLLANQKPTATSDASNAFMAVDDDLHTAWTPDRFPAAVIIPLKHQSTPKQITLDLQNPTHLAISLLNHQGKPLARFERDWSFWDTYATDAMWADGKVTLDLPPVDNVSFIRLELFASRGAVGVNDIALYPTAHRATGWHTGKPITISNDSRSVIVHHQVSEPTAPIKLYANTEASRGYPIFRWSEPWKRTKSPVLLKQFGGHISQVFHGSNIAIILSHTGGLDWQIDDGPVKQIDKTNRETTTIVLADNLSLGRHLLRLTQRALPAHNDQWGANDIRVVSMNINAKAVATPAVRFSSDGKTWGPWIDASPSQETGINIAMLQDGSRPVYAQPGVWFDARSTLCDKSPVLQSLTAETSTAQGRTASTLSREHLPVLSEQIDEVAQQLVDRQVVVTYPKTGSLETFKLAQTLARKANVYLVSDDIGLNNYPGLVLAVGSPLRHRYTRQLLATQALWLNPDFLQSEQGLVTLTYDQQYKPQTLYVMGETQQAIAAATTRLIAKVDQLLVSQSQQPTITKHRSVETFAASTLEMIYPWQLHTSRAVLGKAAVRLGINDRRSMQIGLRFNERIRSLQVKTEKFTGPSGQALAADQLNVRFASGYEWIPFFGDLRLPNGLSHQPVLPIDANTAIGMWLTVTTNAATKPGDYHGNLQVNANGDITQVPVTIKVEPVTLPLKQSIATYSFAGVPYWYTPGSDLWRKAVSALAINEAEHRVNYVSVAFAMNWTAAKHESPGRYAIIDASADADVTAATTASPDRKWQPMQRAVMLKPGQALEIAFAQPIEPWKVGIGFTGEKTKGVVLQALNDKQQWQDVASSQDLSIMSPPILLETSDTLTSPASIYRVIFDSQAPTTVLKITAFTDRNEHEILTCHFDEMFEQMDLIDAAYTQRDLPLPGYISQVQSQAGQISQQLFGVFSTTQNICIQLMGSQLSETLAKTNRHKRFLLKVGDEPRDLAQWAAIAAPYHQAGLQTMTCHGVHYPDMSVATGVLNPWAPNYQHNINLPFLRERQKQGDQLWWYECGVPVTRLTGSPVENLPFYWLTAKWHLQGAMNYAAMHSSDFVMPVPFRYEHGMDHRILFLADGSVMDTTRRELESDGIGDHELIALIRRQLSHTGTPASKAIQIRLDALIEAIVPYKYGYETSPNKWEAARDALYDMAIESE